MYTSNFFYRIVGAFPPHPRLSTAYKDSVVL